MKRMLEPCKLFVIPSWYPSQVDPAAGTFFRDRARILQRAGMKVVVVTSLIHSLKTVNKAPLISSFQGQEQGLMTYRQESINWFPKLPLLSFWYYQYRIKRLCQRAIREQDKPRLVFINSSLWAGAALGKYFHRQGIPYVVSEHLKEFLAPGRFSFLQRKCINQSYRYAAWVIATSTALKKAIAAQFPEASNKLTVIPNPADIEAFQRRDSQLNPGTFRFVSVALFRPEKRLDILIKAFAQVAQRESGASLDLIGDGELRPKLKALTQALGISHQVRFCGYLSKKAVAQKLRHMHCLVLSSAEETFGVALVEAMAAGLPVVATRCGGPEDIVRPATGILTEPNNIDALAGAMIRVMQNYAQYSASQIRSVAEKYYSDSAFVTAIRGLCDPVE